jgi:hypothetical protein
LRAILGTAFVLVSVVVITTTRQTKPVAPVTEESRADVVEV